MQITKHTHSITNIPRQAGTFWIKAKAAKGQIIVICVQHSPNMYQSILQANKTEWLQKDFQSIWIETLLDTGYIQAA